MSYDLFIYSPHAPISCGELRRAMRDDGWVTRVLPSGSFVGSAPFQLLPDNEPLSACLLATWRAEQNNAGLLDEMFKAGNTPGLEELFQKEDAFFTCGFSVSDYTFDPDDLEADSEAEMRKIVGDETVNHLRGTKTQYSLHTRGANLVMSYDFIRATWETLAYLSIGMLEDQQEGAYYIISPKRRLIRLNSSSRRIAHSLRHRIVK